MPYPLSLPTPSNLPLHTYISSPTHPSLPPTTTTYRLLLRHALKSHARLPPPSRPAHLTAVLTALHDYIPYLLALDAGLSGALVAGEEVDVVLKEEVSVRWRAAVTSRRKAELKGLDCEVLYTLATLAATEYLLARRSLSLASTDTAAAIPAATKHLLAAHAVYAYLAHRSTATAPDISPPFLGALASLCLAEATLLAVRKDDPHAAAVARERDARDTQWMFRAPEMPRVRAHLFARVCLAAGEHAGRGAAGLIGVRGGQGLGEYLDGVRRTARGRACRFLGVDEEAGGSLGCGIAWLRAARAELGVAAAGEEGGGVERVRGGLLRLKREWKEKRVEKGVESGSDARRWEELRVVDALMAKWVKMNDTVTFQVVPPTEPLLASMPSGREYHTPKPFEPPSLNESVLAKMRAPPEPVASAYLDEEDSSDGDDEVGDPVGAFPGTKAAYSGSGLYC